MYASQSLEDGSFHKNQVLLNAFKQANAGNGRVHFLGLVRCARVAYPSDIWPRPTEPS
jgi:bisphosphoglycerate-independent phosphoglycerate mutase (AlkP superfamily)